MAHAVRDGVLRHFTAAMTTEEQSVSGMKPMRTSFFSGASEPAAQAPLLAPGGTRLMSAAPPATCRKSRREGPLPAGEGSSTVQVGTLVARSVECLSSWLISISAGS